jgi:hypothetical protein
MSEVVFDLTVIGSRCEHRENELELDILVLIECLVVAGPSAKDRRQIFFVRHRPTEKIRLRNRITARLGAN